jgi:hypothetical protein
MNNIKLRFDHNQLNFKYLNKFNERFQFTYFGPNILNIGLFLLA